MTTRAHKYDVGTPIDNVTVNIDHRIIEHFSKHLYASPNKAIEELVANGFDAFASQVRVYTPGQMTPERLLVWDNGESMDVAGIKSLWWIAKSPKELVPGREARSESGLQRKLIGKFGIGKLASYTVGRTMSHLCRRGDEFLLVSIDYGVIDDAPDSEDGSRPSPITTPIASLTTDEALAFAEGLFSSMTADARALFDEPHWTLAIVEDLKVHHLQDGRLRWVLSNGMPLRPDFRLYVNDDEVLPKVERAGAVGAWDMASSEVQEALSAEWKAAVDGGRVTGELSFDSRAGIDPRRPQDEVPVVVLPAMGDVWARVRLFQDSLVNDRQFGEERSHGFFIMVRDRLLNESDAEVFLRPPSFGTFNRAYFEVHADGLDDIMLADRERLQRESRHGRELEVLQHALYKVARAKQSALDAEEAKRSTTSYRLPLHSSRYFAAPLTNLLSDSDESYSLDKFSGPDAIGIRSCGPGSRLATVSKQKGAFVINSEHPYYQALEDRFGSGSKAQEYRREYQIVAVGECLFEGFVRELPIPDNVVDQILDWRDGYLRAVAEVTRVSAPEIADRLLATSKVGAREFEEAVAEALDYVGFKVERDGSRGEKDVVMQAVAGPKSYMLTFEMKGSKKDVPNDAAEVSGAANHRDRAGAEHAVIVARSFVGQENEESALLGECRATGGVSVMTVDALIALVEAVENYAYPLPLLKEVFTTIEPAADKLDRIQRLDMASGAFDFRAFLEQVAAYQTDTQGGDAQASLSDIYQRNGYSSRMGYDEFKGYVYSLQTLAMGWVNKGTLGDDTLYISTTPDRIAEAVADQLRRKSPQTTPDREPA